MLYFWPFFTYSFSFWSTFYFILFSSLIPLVLLAFLVSGAVFCYNFPEEGPGDQHVGLNWMWPQQSLAQVTNFFKKCKEKGKKQWMGEFFVLVPCVRFEDKITEQLLRHLPKALGQHTNVPVRKRLLQLLHRLGPHAKHGVVPRDLVQARVREHVPQPHLAQGEAGVADDVGRERGCRRFFDLVRQMGLEVRGRLERALGFSFRLGQLATPSCPPWRPSGIPGSACLPLPLRSLLESRNQRELMNT